MTGKNIAWGTCEKYTHLAGCVGTGGLGGGRRILRELKVILGYVLSSRP